MRCFSQRFLFSLLKVTPTAFWTLFNEKDPRKYQLLLQSSGFLEAPHLLSPKFSALLIYSYTKKTPYPDPKISQKLLSLYELQKNLMNKQDFVNVSWAFSKLFPKNSALWLDLEKKILINSKEFSLRETVTIIHSFSRVLQGSEDFWLKQEVFLMPQIVKLGEKELSIVIWAFSNNNRYKNEDIWLRFESQILASRLKDIEFIASLIYSFGKANKGSLALWASFEKNIVVNLPSLTSRYLANIVWAFAKAGKNFNKSLLEKYIEVWTLKEICEGNEPRNLMNVLWGLNKLNKGDSKFWEAVFDKIKEKSTIFLMNGQDLINLAWIFRNRVFGKMPAEILTRFLWVLEENLKEISKGKGLEEVKIKAHECFYEGEGGGEVWRGKGEEFCLKYVKEGAKSMMGKEAWKENLKDIGILMRKFDGLKNSENYKELKELLNKYR